MHRILKPKDVRKAIDPNGISLRVLREFASELEPDLAHLYFLCLNTNIFPQC